jgi:C-terminal binding protein
MTAANTLSQLSNGLSNGHANGGKQDLVILELEGMFSEDSVEDAIWQQAPKHNYNIKFIRGNLSPGGDGDSRPISDLSDELCASVDGLMVFRHYFTRQDIERFPKLKVVVRCGVGYDRLDRVALAERNITVCHLSTTFLTFSCSPTQLCRSVTCPITAQTSTCTSMSLKRCPPSFEIRLGGLELTALAFRIADHTLALALSLRRGILIHNERQRATPAAPWQPAYSPLVSRIQGQVFGVLGLGRIGTAAAIRARAFGW